MRAVGLEYHDVISGEDFDASGFPGAAAASYKLTSAHFDAHLAAITAIGACIARADALERVPDGATPVFLTFDDGGAGAFTHTLPLLARRGWPGHFLVTTGRVGTRGFLSAEQIALLRESGHVIGSHSCTHPLRFAALSRRDMLREWAESRRALEEIVAAPVIVASIPGGQYRRSAAEAAAEAGYRVLFTSEPVARSWMVDGCMVLGRYSVRRATPPAEAAALATGRAPECRRQWAAWNAKKVLKAAGGRAYLALRERIFEHGRAPAAAPDAPTPIAPPSDAVVPDVDARRPRTRAE